MAEPRRQTPVVSIIIPNCNRYSKLIRTLNALISEILDQNLIDSAEILVVDDGSEAMVSGQIRAYLSQHNRSFLRYFLLEKNGGPSIARNRGVRESRGDPLARFTQLHRSRDEQVL